MVKDFLGQNKVAKKGFKHDFAYIKGQTILLFSFLGRGVEGRVIWKIWPMQHFPPTGEQCKADIFSSRKVVHVVLLIKHEYLL